MSTLYGREGGGVAAELGHRDRARRHAEASCDRVEPEGVRVPDLRGEGHGVSN